jgi:CelD/BcsL family acetyltransferase involved in cellulose biosynthesis
MARFERINLDAAEWGKTLSCFSDRIVFQTPAWLAFLAESQNAEPVLAALREGNESLGYFTGGIVKKFGLRILGSPFGGWSTPYMGFNLRPSVPRRSAVEALADFAFKDLGCIHCEVTDLRLSRTDIHGLGFSEMNHATMEIDLTQSEEALLANMTKSCRWTVRKAEKNGVVIEEAQDAGFADEYAEQLKDVFAKQKLVPHFGAERVRALLRHLRPTATLLTLRARDPEGRCIATGIYVALHETAFFWGGASWRQYQKLYPNELLQWHAMRYWKQRGLRTYNMVGNMDFKRKFGGAETAVPMIYQSKHRLLAQMRSSAVPIVKAALRLIYKLKSPRHDRTTESAPDE